MASPELLARISAAKRAVMAQTELLSRGFGRTESQWKTDGTRVTAVDIAISENIFRELHTMFPDDQFFSEELAGVDDVITVTAPFSWVLDPIDGTNNFAAGLPSCAIALGLFENGQPAYGVIYDLSRHTLMHGGPGFGMMDGDRVATVRNLPLNKETLVGYHSPFDKVLMPQATGVLAEFKIRALGSSTLHLAYVAAGLLDGCVDFNVKIWDLAAAIPLVFAAGGEVHFLNGEQLPLRKFDLKMGRIFYVSGAAPICARLKQVMGVN